MPKRAACASTQAYVASAIAACRAQRAAIGSHDAIAASCASSA
jgi:hypothetical protein